MTDFLHPRVGVAALREKYSELPDESGVVPDEKPAEENWVHNWLYSVVPIGIKETDYGNNQTDFPLFAFLTGFCRECRKAFSAQIPHISDGRYFETQMEIPVYGCVKPGTYR